VITFSTIVGNSSDPEIRGILATLEARDQVSHIAVRRSNLGKRRFKASDQSGTEFGIALSRNETIADGSVLLLSAHHAVIIDAEDDPSLNLSAVTIEGALQLGWQAGHLHWKVRTEKHKLVVALEGPVDDYLKRIEALVEAGHVRVVS
jgi:urease accessory protein